jgi:hypothetical protein
MLVLRNAVLGLALVLIGNFVFAAATINGKITQVRVDASGAGIVVFSVLLTSPSACTIPYFANAMAFNTNTTGGKALLANILSARNKNGNVYAGGTGTCAVYNGSVEDLNYLIEY